MGAIGNEERPLRVAVVGSGPSGFYAAEALLRGPVPARVDVFDRLPTPFGLVRGGVAPDHPKIKTVIRAYEKTATSPGFAFFGNVMVGRDVSIADLQRHYDAILLATGAETDRRLGIPGEDLRGSHTATEFVGWYNGHPDYRDCTFDLSGEVAMVVGQGNVAMDVSRILAKTADELRETDIASHALEVLAESRIREIHVVGRRGPAQVKFTPPEIREIGELAACDPLVDANALELGEACRAEAAAARETQQNLEILREFAARVPSGDKPRRFRLWFLASPTALEGEGRVERVVLERNRLEGEAFAQRAVGTGEHFTLPCDVFFRSVGYRGLAIEGVPFDTRNGVIPNRDGRVIGEDGAAIPGLYVAGWIKRGPSGVIGTNKADAKETVAALLADLQALPPAPEPDSAALAARLAERGVRTVGYDDWRVLDAAETARGKAAGKPREKFTRIAEMLAALTER